MSAIEKVYLGSEIEKFKKFNLGFSDDDFAALKRLTQPLIIPVAKQRFRTVQEYHYYYERDGWPFQLIVPVGFEFDGATVNRWLWSISNITPSGLINAAALLHDFIYHYEGKLPVGSHLSFNGLKQPSLADPENWTPCVGRPWRRADADRLFRKVMQQSGFGETDRDRAYWAVRLFGWIYWREF